MTAAPCPDPDDLRRLIEERLGPIRAAEIEAHVETCMTCQGHLERLTARPEWCRADRATREAGSSDGCALDAAETEADGVTTDLIRENPPAPSETSTDSRGGDSATAEGPDGVPPGSTDLEPGDLLAADRTATFDAGDGAPGVSPVSRRYGPRPEWPVIPGYELRQKLGEGGMGVVFLARQVGLNRPVAIEMIRGGSQARPEHFARFRVEAEAIARLRHPHVIQIYDIGEAGGLPYVSLELLDGGGLDDRLGGTPRPGREAAELLITLAEAIQVAHDAGIVHRDLKPSNVLFTRDGAPKVTDFGLAKRLKSDSRQTESGAIMGSPSYMAPEQARGHAKDVGPAADVYALGAILYEMLTGRAPFKGETPIETIRQVVDTEVVPPSRLVPRIARDLETICLKCLNKEPSKRYESARALADDLARYCSGRTILARRASALERGTKWARRRPAAAALVALSLIAVLGLAVWGALYVDSRNRFQVAGSRRDLELLRTGNQLRDSAREAKPEGLIQVQRDIANFRGVIENEDTSRIPELPAQMADAAGLAEERLQGWNESKALEECRRADRRRFDDFGGLRTQAQLNAAEYLLSPVEGKTRFRGLVHQALAVYARDPRAPDEDWMLTAELPAVLSDTEKATVVEGCYDLLLLLSQTVEPASGLRVLDRAARLRPEPTAAYHLRRAECLARLGDAAGRDREDELAGRRPIVTALDHFLIGRERLIARRWEESIESLEKSLELDPRLTAAHHLLAIGYAQGQPRRLDEALGSINICIRVHRNQVGLYLLRAFILGEQGNRLLGIAEERPAESTALRRRAAAAFETAQRDYHTALEAHPDDDIRYVLLVNRGGMYLQAGRQADSLEDLRAAIRLRPAPYEAYATLAQLYEKQGRLDESSRAFAQAIERAPDPAVRVALHRSRALLHSAHRDATPEQRAAALRDLEEAIRLGRGDRSQVASDHAERARLLFAGGRPEAALEACAAAIKLVPDHAGAHQLRISALMALKRFDEVLGSCDAYLAREEPTVEVLEIRGLARVARRDLSGAIADYTRAIELRRDLEPAVKARLLNRRGWAHHFADATRLALDDFEASLTLVADQAEAHAGRGFARVRLGDRKEAVTDADAAVRLLGTMPTAEGAADARLQARFNAARIYAQATELAAAEVSRQGERAVELYRAYRRRALDLLRQTLDDAPAEDRDRILSDPALRPLRLGRQVGQAGLPDSVRSDRK